MSAFTRGLSDFSDWEIKDLLLYKLSGKTWHEVGGFYGVDPSGARSYLMRMWKKQMGDASGTARKACKSR